ncbi:MAG: hypothetical protein QGF36_07120, partial [Candidatus Marinimicrobia bacterium]|nr:hypothetical protein [Candidatus Neomarinimicrobiota bacterium]
MTACNGHLGCAGVQCTEDDGSCYYGYNEPDGEICINPGECPYDCVGVCNYNIWCDGTCVQNGPIEDCLGECGGTAELDECGECGGDGSSCLGCTDQNACNYDSGQCYSYEPGTPGYCIDDGSCLYWSCNGCCVCTEDDVTHLSCNAVKLNDG